MLMTFNLTQAIIEQVARPVSSSPRATSPNGPDRSSSSSCKRKDTLEGKTVAVIGDTTESTVVNDTIVPDLKKAGVKLGDTAVLDIGTTGDYTAALAQLASFIEKWKTEHVDAVFLSGDLASTKAFVEPLKKAVPEPAADGRQHRHAEPGPTGSTSGDQAQPLRRVAHRGGIVSSRNTTAAPNWKYCADIYQAATGKPAPNAAHTIKLANGKINDVNGTITDACRDHSDVPRHRAAGRARTSTTPTGSTPSTTSGRSPTAAPARTRRCTPASTRPTTTGASRNTTPRSATPASGNQSRPSKTSAATDCEPALADCASRAGSKSVRGLTATDPAVRHGCRVETSAFPAEHHSSTHRRARRAPSGRGRRRSSCTTCRRGRCRPDTSASTCSWLSPVSSSPGC